MRLKELYLKIINNSTCTLEEISEFIELAIKIIIPEKKYDKHNIIYILQMGLPIVQPIIDMVEKNPDKVGFQVIKIWSKPNINNGERILIKTICYDIL